MTFCSDLLCCKRELVHGERQAVPKVMPMKGECCGEKGSQGGGRGGGWGIAALNKAVRGGLMKKVAVIKDGKEMRE